MQRWILHEGVDVLFAHRDDYLFSWEFLGRRLDSWFGFWDSINNAVDLVDLLCVKSRESFLDFENLWCVGIGFGGLSVWPGRAIVTVLVLAFSQRFLALKVFGDGIYFLLGFARRGGRGGFLLMVTGTGFACSSLFLKVVRTILGVNLDEIFSLSDLELLSVLREFQLAW